MDTMDSTNPMDTKILIPFCLLLLALTSCGGSRQMTGMSAYERGVAYSRDGKAGKAMDEFNDEIKHKPDNADAYFQRGLLFMEKERYDYAIIDFTKSIKLDPKNPEAYYKRGAAYYKKGNSKAALEDFGDAMQLKK